MALNSKISVITICYNAAKYVEKTIESVLHQRFQDYEYIIVDGGSTDGTLDIIKKYEGNPRVKWISESDRGIYDALNKGIKMAKGEWINCMNAGDCFATDDVLEKVFSVEYPGNIKFLYSDNYYIDEKGKETYAVHDHQKLSILHQSSIYKKELHKTCGQYIVTPKIIVSDLLFFAAVPEECFQKIDIPISRNLKGGVSASSWCVTQALCTKVVFRKLTFSQMLMHYISAQTKRNFPFLQTLQNCVRK